MTKEELQEILRDLELDYEAEPTLIYLFYALPDGRVNNFSISVRRGDRMSDRKLERLMRSEYPATRQGKVVRVERPNWEPPTEWLDVTDVGRMLHVSDRTVRSWAKRGVLHPTSMQGGRKLYFDREEIDRVLASNAVMENGRIDLTALPEWKEKETNGKERK